VLPFLTTGMVPGPAGWSVMMADAGYGVPRSGGQEGDILLLQTGADRPGLYRTPWAEPRGDGPAPGGIPPIFLAKVGDTATDPLVPVRDGPFQSDPARWLLWREGAVVHALGTAGETRALTLPQPPATLLRPALQREGGDVLAFALAADRRRVLILRFPRAGGSAFVTDTLTLPLAAESGTSAFTPDGGVLLGLSAVSGGDTRLMLGRMAASALRSAVIPKVQPVPHAQPALLAGADDAAVVAALVMTANGLALAEARFGATGEPAVSLRPLGRTAAAPVRAALLYRADAAWPSAVIGLGDGTLLFLTAQGELAPMPPHAKPAANLVLVPAKRGALLLCIDRQRGPVMVAV
jgi:hypothetical protein